MQCLGSQFGQQGDDRTQERYANDQRDVQLLKIRSSSRRNSDELSGSAARRRLFLRNIDPIHQTWSSEKISPVTSRLSVASFQSTLLKAAEVQ